MATERQFSAIQSSSTHNLQHWQHLSDRHFTSIEQHAKFQLREVSMTTESNMQRIRQMSYNKLARTTDSIESLHHSTKYNSQKLLSEVAKQVRYYQQVVLIQNPARLLDQGYAFVKNAEDTYLNSVESIDKGDFVTVAMSDGRFKAVVYDVLHDQNS